MAPHRCLSGFDYPFGLIIFSHKQLNTDSYSALATNIMPNILSKFLNLYEHTVDSIKPFLANPTAANTRNQVKYAPPTSGTSYDQSGLHYSNLTGNSIVIIE